MWTFKFCSIFTVIWKLDEKHLIKKNWTLDQNDLIKSPILAGHLNKSQKYLWPGGQFRRTINGHFDHVTIINLFVSSRKMLSDYRI